MPTLRWEDAGDTGVCFGAEAQGQPPAIAEYVRRCSLPLVVRYGQGAAVRGTVTLLRAGRQCILLCAAHLFDDGVRLGDLMLPAPEGGWLGLEGAQLCRDAEADIAFVVPNRRAQLALIDAWHVVPESAIAGDAAEPEGGQYFIAGYPAAMTRMDGGYLAGKRLMVTSCELATNESSGSHQESAPVWAVRRLRGQRQLVIVGVQSSFRHSRYLRAHRLTPLQIRRTAL